MYWCRGMYWRRGMYCHRGMYSTLKCQGRYCDSRFTYRLALYERLQIITTRLNTFFDWSTLGCTLAFGEFSSGLFDWWWCWSCWCGESSSTTRALCSQEHLNNFENWQRNGQQDAQIKYAARPGLSKNEDGADDDEEKDWYYWGCACNWDSKILFGEVESVNKQSVISVFYQNGNFWRFY